MAAGDRAVPSGLCPVERLFPDAARGSPVPGLHPRSADAPRYILFLSYVRLIQNKCFHLTSFIF